MLKPTEMRDSRGRGAHSKARSSWVCLFLRVGSFSGLKEKPKFKISIFFLGGTLPIFAGTPALGWWFKEKPKGDPCNKTTPPSFWRTALACQEPPSPADPGGGGGPSDPGSPGPGFRSFARVSHAGPGRFSRGHSPILSRDPSFWKTIRTPGETAIGF